VKQIPKIDMMNYLDGNKINYSKLLTDEVLAVDKLLLDAAKKNMDIAGNLSCLLKNIFISSFYHRKECRM
jgi:protein phosphatase 1L